MFGSHNAYGGYGNNHGNTPYYPASSANDSFWGNNVNRQSQNRVNYRNPTDASIASDSLYGYQNSHSDSSVKQIETGLAGINLNKSKGLDDYGSLKSIGTGKKTTTWASVASQPAKSQPKLLKSKMAASGLTGSTSKHLPPTVTMDAISWDSKNGAIGNGPLGSKTIPPPTVISAPSISPVLENPVPPNPVPMEQQYRQKRGVAETPALPLEPIQGPWGNSREVVGRGVGLSTGPPPPPPPMMVRGENSWHSNGNSSPVGSLHNSDSSPRSSRTPTLSRASHVNNEHNGNYNQNKYSNQPRGYPKQPVDNQSSSNRSQTHSISSAPPSNSSDDLSSKENVLEKLIVQNNYNPREFEIDPSNARFFIIKSYSEDDIHRSIKYSIWCSTEHGNRRLDTAFREQENKGPIYLFFSVNRSGHFCGIAQMVSPVDYNASSGVWCQDKWKGQFKVKWIYIKDVPNDQLRHITLENNENKPVTNSRDTQEVPFEKGKKVLAIIHMYNHQTSIFDDFLHYEKKQEEELRQKPESSSSPPPPSHYQKMPLSSSQYNSRDNQVPYRERNYNHQRERVYPYRADGYRNDHRDEYRNERNDYRGGYAREDRGYREMPSGRDYLHRPGPEREYHQRDSYRERDMPPPQRDFARDHRPNERQQSWRN